MCGISGWLSQKPLASNDSVTPADTNPQQILEQMNAAIRHRGPDGQGTFLSDHIALGHVRLAIIDLDSGQQPMNSQDRQVMISFNGEIYNYRELRQQLVAQGYSFRTHSDTEVILALYQTKGSDGFALLRGMYAFVIWDKPERRACLVRDPLGIKPLFIYGDQHQLVFGSEAKAILAHPDCHAGLDTSSLHTLMNFRYLPGDRSLFSGIRQLSPGTVMTWHQDDGISTSRITPPACNSDNDILAAFDDSVRAHFTADVEVGCYLSGGIDSAAVCALGKTHLTNPEQTLQTFTLDAGDDPMEADYARRSAGLLGVNNHCEAVRFDPLQALPEMLWHLEVPKINALQIKLLAQVAARKVKVCLSGLGGDEAFYGYNIHRFMYQAHKLAKFLPGITHRWAGRLGKRLSDLLQAVAYTETSRQFEIVQSLGHWSKVYGLMRNVWDRPELRTQIYGPRMLAATLPDCNQILDELWPEDTDPVAALATFENRHKLINDLLWQEDRMSMACGLEVRVPFVDQPFLQAVHQYNRTQLMPQGHPKQLMKELFIPVLGKEILQRPKSGFQVSSPDFFHQHLSVMARQWLSPETVSAYGLFNPDFIQKILRLNPSKKLRWHYFVLYLMLLTHVWIELFENHSDYQHCQPRAFPADSLRPG